MKAITPTKVLALPTQLDPHLLYLTKDKNAGVNATMADKSGLRPATFFRNVRLRGPKELYASGGVVPSGVYTISNYCAFTPYEVSVSAGSVSVAGNQITVTPPTEPGNIYLCVNGEYSKIVVRPHGVAAPEIIYPTIGNLPLFQSFDLMLSPFQVTSGTDVCAGIDVQVSKDSSFVEGVSNFTVNGAVSTISIGPIEVGENYYTRARYRAAVYGAGRWSQSVRFDINNDTVGFQELASIESYAGNFASDLSVSGNGKLILVCSPWAYLSKGAAYLYALIDGSWLQVKEFKNATGNLGDSLGKAGVLSSDGMTLALSATGMNANDGAVFIHKKLDGQWVQDTILNPPASATAEGFGTSLAISSDGSTLAVGSAYADSANQNTGAVYIFTKTNGTWLLQQKIAPEDLLTNDLFGQSVSLSADGNVLSVGAPYQGTDPALSGGVYVFKRVGSAWTQETKVTASVPKASSLFGIKTAVSGDGLTILAAELGTIAHPGTVYVFNNVSGTWTLLSALTSTLSFNEDNFGATLVLNHLGTKAVIGCSSWETNKGSAFVFEKANGIWTQTQAIIETISTPGNKFGRSIAANDDVSLLVVGTLGSELVAGTVYVYK